MLSKTTMKKVLASVCTATIAISALSGCSAKSSSASSSSSSGTSSKGPIKFSVMLQYQDEVPQEKNQVLDAINKLCNSDIQFTWVPAINYNDKFNVVMASNQLPDALVIPDVKLTSYVSAARAGMFWDLTSQIQNYPNLKAINSLLTQNASTDGKLYMVPRERAIKRDMIIYRTDWAKAAGVGAPDSLDNIYKAAKAFAEGDFDKNGKKDTIGLGLGVNNNALAGLNPLVVANGGFNGYGLVDGKVTPTFMTKEYMDTLKWLKKMYDEKLLSPDFAITKTTEVLPNLFDKQLTGIYYAQSPVFLTDPLYKQMLQQNPNLKRSEMAGYTFLKDSKGSEKVPATAGIAGGVAFPKPVVKDEARLKDLLSVYDKIQSKEGQLLINNGIKDIHYKQVDDNFCTTPNLELNKKEVVFGQLGIGGGYALTTKNDDLDEAIVKDRKKIDGNILVTDVTYPLLSDTYTNNKANLDKIIDSAALQFIMGKINEQQFNDAIAQWKQTGGDKVLQEYNDQYAKSKK